MADCVFCRILAGELQAERLIDRERVVAILDINPIAHGHALVMPRAHHETLTDLPPDLASELMLAVRETAAAVLKATGAEGYNVLANNRRCSGQAIDHVHVHVIPRRAGDQIKFGWTTRTYGDGEMPRTAESIRKALG